MIYYFFEIKTCNQVKTLSRYKDLYLTIRIIFLHVSLFVFIGNFALSVFILIQFISVHQEHKKKGQLTREDASEKNKKKTSQISSIDSNKKRGPTSRVDTKDNNKKRGQLFREDSLESHSRKKGLSTFRKTEDVTESSKKRGHSFNSVEDSRKGIFFYLF